MVFTAMYTSKNKSTRAFIGPGGHVPGNYQYQSVKCSGLFFNFFYRDHAVFYGPKFFKEKTD